MKTSFQHKHVPTCKGLQKYISHYWHVHDADQLFKKASVYGYPGITPEIIIPLKGHFEIEYQGSNYKLQTPLLFSHLENRILLDTTMLESFIIISFKSRSISSLLPFIHVPASELIKNPICSLGQAFNCNSYALMEVLKEKEGDGISHVLDSFFATHLIKDHDGFILELMDQTGTYGDLKEIMRATNYSYSTIERYYKKETGLTPKKYLSLYRYKKAVQEIYETLNGDWMHYVEKYGYYDQSHFIKEIKKYTHFTPSQLLDVPGLLSYRP